MVAKINLRAITVQIVILNDSNRQNWTREPGDARITRTFLGRLLRSDENEERDPMKDEEK